MKRVLNPWMWACLLLAVGAVTAYWWTRSTPQRVFAASCEAWERSDLASVRTGLAELQEVPGYEAHVHLLEGMLQLRGGKLFESVEHFGKATENPDTRLLAFALAGEALYKARRFMDAIGTLNRALELDADHLESHRWLAATYYDLGAMDAALVHLEKIGELAEDDSRPFRLKGLIFRDYERYEDAIVAYQEALDRSPLPAVADQIRFELAQSLSQARRYEESLELLKQVPTSSASLTLEAANLFSLGDKPAALERIEAAIKADPNDPKALVQKADLLLDRREPEEAAAILQHSIQLDPYNYSAHMKLGQTWQLLGEPEKAKRALAEMQRLQELRTRFTKLHEAALSEASNAELRFELGEVALELGMVELARSWFEAAVGIDPAHAEAMKALKALQ